MDSAFYPNTNYNERSNDVYVFHGGKMLAQLTQVITLQSLILGRLLQIIAEFSQDLEEDFQKLHIKLLTH